MGHQSPSTSTVRYSFHPTLTDLDLYTSREASQCPSLPCPTKGTET